MAAGIWHQHLNVQQLNDAHCDTLVEKLGIEFTEVGPDFLKARMPVDGRTINPEKILHGGASVSLAESVASVAATLCINSDTHLCVGMEINANHLRPMREGYVEATTRPLHIGRTSQVWQTEIRNSEGKLVCVSRMTIAVIPRPGQSGNPYRR